MRIRMTAEERSWVLYDVGNSAFVLIMVTAIMPIFFKDYAASHLPAAVSTANWGFANSTASLILALLAPILGARLPQRGFEIAALDRTDDAGGATFSLTFPR